jgi:hypothetical protein
MGFRNIVRDEFHFGERVQVFGNDGWIHSK